MLDQVKINFSTSINTEAYPFYLSIIKNLKDIHFPNQITFFVGENGTGQSTLLEAIAYKAGFGVEGGNKNINFKTSQENTYAPVQQLADQLILSWRQKPKDGYFSGQKVFTTLQIISIILNVRVVGVPMCHMVENLFTLNPTEKVFYLFLRIA